MVQDTAQASALSLLEQFRTGALTPSAHVEACLDRIEQFNPLINAVTATCFDRARSEAKAADQRYRDGRPKGPLDGLALGVKDLQPTAGLLTTMGSPIWRNHVPDSDLPMVAALRAAGAIVVGKTNVPEHGAGGNSRNPVWGATGNPFDPNRIAGGSSGGSAAALAAGLLPLCTGSDTGGSLRLPASVCGVVGFRPSPGLVPHPTRPLGWSAISVLGPMARDIGDLLLMLDTCVGQSHADPLNRDVQWPLHSSHAPKDLSRLRVGYSMDLGGCPVDADIRATFADRIARIAPHVQSCVEVDWALGDMDRCFDVLRAESFLAGFAADALRRPEALSADILANVALGQGFTLADRAWAHAEQTRILRRYQVLATEFDVILAPTVPVSPFEWIHGSPAAVDGQAMDIYYRWLALTYRPTLTACPVLTVPCGVDAQGMPFGMQILGQANEDAALLSVGLGFERLFQATPEMRRPVPNLRQVQASRVPLQSIVTAAPDGHIAALAAQPLTAV